jgi:hypothetical protein
MDFFASHPSFINLTVTAISLVAQIVIAAALVVIAISLRKKDK